MVTKDKSLVKKNTGFWAKIKYKLRKVFSRKSKYEEDKNIESVSQNLQEQSGSSAKQIRPDIDILRDVINGKIKIENLDLETEKRLIQLCVDKNEQLEDEIEMYDEKIEQVKSNLKRINI